MSYPSVRLSGTGFAAVLIASASLVLAPASTATAGTSEDGDTRATEAARIVDDPRLLIPPLTAPSVPAADAYEHRLPAGPVVFAGADSTLPLVDLIAVIPVGSDQDPAGKSGLALLTAALARRAGSGARDATEFDLEVERLGAEIGTHSTAHRTLAYLQTPSWNLDPALDLFIGLLLRPRFEAASVDHLVGNLVDSLERRRSDPWALLDRERALLRFRRNTPGHRPLTGPELRSISLGDLRSFHRHHWRRDEMTFAASGDFDPAELVQALQRRLAASPVVPQANGEPSPPPRLADPSCPPAPVGLRFLPHPSAEVKVSIGLPLPRSAGESPANRAALAVAAEILGGHGGLSRIQGRLRTGEGLVYQARVDLLLDDRCGAELVIEFSSRPEHVGAAIQAAADELQHIATRPVDAGELAIAKRSLLSQLRSGWDTEEEIVGQLADDRIEGRQPDFWHRYAEAAARVTVEGVLGVSAAHLTPRRALAVTVGDWRPSPAENLAPIAPTMEPIPRRDPLTLTPLDDTEGRRDGGRR